MKTTHIVSAWGSHGKSSEITAVPLLLEVIQIKGNIITIDAIGIQIAIAEKIKSRRADYVLAIKGNQKTLLWRNVLQ